MSRHRHHAADCGPILLVDPNARVIGVGFMPGGTAR